MMEADQMQGAAVMVVAVSLINSVAALLLMSGVIAGEPCYPAMFVFGDSLSDTGNAVIMGNSYALLSTRVPYGETFPGRPFDRFSDGRLMIDNLAKHLGLPFLNPFCNTTANFTNGVNYAIVGATALNTSYLNSLLIFPSDEWYADEQLAWHLSLKAEVEELPRETQAGRPSLASFADGLYVIWIGGNDYAAAFNSTASYSTSYINATFVPIVVQKIRQIAETLYMNGARNFLFFDAPALGCVPRSLAQHLLATRDGDGCLEDYNTVAYSHGMLLLSEVESLRRTYPDATFLFADYYGAHLYILRNQEQFGFRNGLDACCGAGPRFPYNDDSSHLCSCLDCFVCMDPNTYINWDGVHPTDNFISEISKQIFNTGSYLNPSNGLMTCFNANTSDEIGWKETTSATM